MVLQMDGWVWMVINGSLCGVRYRTPCGANKGILRVQFGKLLGFVTNLYAGEYLGRKQMRFGLLLGFKLFLVWSGLHA